MFTASLLRLAVKVISGHLMGKVMILFLSDFPFI